MSAERLREAAKALRQLARCGGPLEYPAPWGFRHTEGEGVEHHGIAALVTTNPEDDGEVTDWIDEGVAAYIATMHPGVGLALADWLDEAAEKWHADYREWHRPFDAGWWTEPGAQEPAATKAIAHFRSVSVEYADQRSRSALAVADAILGGES